jgi:ABC-2 type transport system ATP-binding protein
MIDIRSAAPAASAPVGGDTVLGARDLVKHYGTRTAVNGLNLAVRRGEILGFLGPNGAGKTTTIRMALGLITPTSGTVEVLGHDVAAERRAVLPRVGALIETPALHLYMSGRDNLRAVADILGGVPEARIQAVLAQVGLAGRQKDRVRTYSLGMKQRLGVAIALLNDPELLILDEPANGLDPAGIVEMRDLLRDLAANGKTVFISSHVLGEVQQICTRVAIINLGKLVTEATVEELTRGHGEFVVRVENTSAALLALHQQPWGTGARLAADGVIHTAAPEGQGRHIAKALTDAGVYPDQIAFEQESLEEVFLRLTGTTDGEVR